MHEKYLKTSKSDRNEFVILNKICGCGTTQILSQIVPSFCHIGISDDKLLDI